MIVYLDDVGFLIAIGKWFLLLDFIVMQCVFVQAHRCRLSDTYGFVKTSLYAVPRRTTLYVLHLTDYIACKNSAHALTITLKLYILK